MPRQLAKGDTPRGPRAPPRPARTSANPRVQKSAGPPGPTPVLPRSSARFPWTIASTPPRTAMPMPRTTTPMIASCFLPPLPRLTLLRLGCLPLRRLLVRSLPLHASRQLRLVLSRAPFDDRAGERIVEDLVGDGTAPIARGNRAQDVQVAGREAAENGVRAPTPGPRELREVPGRQGRSSSRPRNQEAKDRGRRRLCCSGASALIDRSRWVPMIVCAPPSRSRVSAAGQREPASVSSSQSRFMTSWRYVVSIWSVPAPTGPGPCGILPVLARGELAPPDLVEHGVHERRLDPIGLRRRVPFVDALDRLDDRGAGLVPVEVVEVQVVAVDVREATPEEIAEPA